MKKDISKINFNKVETNKQEQQAPIQSKKIEISEALNNKFKDFEKTVSDFSPEIGTGEFSEGEPIQPIKTSEPVKPTFEQELKVKMFLGLCSFLLGGFNTFLLNFLRKTKVPFDKMILSDAELLQFTPYFSSQEILVWLDKIPGWVIGMAHYEYMMFQKHAEFSDEYKIIPKEKENKKEEKNG